MERYEILKSVGFSDNFINALDEFEKCVPNISYEVPFDENQQTFNVIDTSGQLLINRPNDNYNSNIIIQQVSI